MLMHFHKSNPGIAYKVAFYKALDYPFFNNHNVFNNKRPCLKKSTNFGQK